MDLNLLYFQQQRAMMRAASATDMPARERHLCAANCFSSRIEQFRRSVGADLIPARAQEN